MHFTTSYATVLAVASSALALPTVSSAGNSIVAYWGQGDTNIPLSDVCSNPNVDIVVLSFVNIFPDQSPSGWPGTNFGSSCGGQTISKPDGTATQLLDGAHCGTMIPDIAACRAAGKKLLLSIAGGYPTDQWLHSDISAISFAQFLVGAFGAPTASWTAANGPRPIGNSWVDGFDFDIESNFPVAPVFDGQSYSDAATRGYATMANTLHDLGYLTSAAPQCARPDVHLGPALNSGWFDYVFVQFYNTAGCSAMDFIQGKPDSFNFNDWTSASYVNPNTKVYIGLPASTASANSGFYLTPTQVHTLLSSFVSTSNFGGIMLWEATASARNLICGNDYACQLNFICGVVYVFIDHDHVVQFLQLICHVDIIIYPYIAHNYVLVVRSSRYFELNIVHLCFTNDYIIVIEFLCYFELIFKLLKHLKLISELL
ncbi:glycoside hydrolase [Venturia nashicola]|nr:glycoside hydrolase [Venturia nashicola]